MNKLFSILIFSMLSSLSVSAQDKIALKTNLLYGGLALKPNLGLVYGKQLPLANRWDLEFNMGVY